MTTAIISLGIGYFVTYKVPSILNLKGTASTVVKIIGIILLILGFVSLVEGISDFISPLLNK